MAKDIKLRMGGQIYNLEDVAYIETIGDDGEKHLWIPEDETRTTPIIVNTEGVYTPSKPVIGYSSVVVESIDPDPNKAIGILEVSKNGIYRAATDPNGPYFGYSKVIVNVEQSDTTYPKFIRVTRMPDKTVYSHGDKVDSTGLQVTAYDDLGRIWDDMGYTKGIIPNEELSFALQYSGRYAIVEDSRVSYVESSSYKYFNENTGSVDMEVVVTEGEGPIYMYELYEWHPDDSAYHSYMTIVSTKSFKGYRLSYKPSNSIAYYNAQLRTHADDPDEKPIYYYNVHAYQPNFPGYSSLPRYSSNYYIDHDNVAYAVLYGDLFYDPNDSVKVTWSKLGKDHTYYTNYNVNIV